MATKLVTRAVLCFGLGACAATGAQDTSIGDPASANGATAGAGGANQAGDAGGQSGASGGVNAGSASGAANGGTSADPDGDGVCMEYTLRNQHASPDMLIVLDRSGSMAASGNDQMVDRWSGSVRGVKAITKKLDDVIQFGLMTFPSDSDCGAGTVKVGVAPTMASTISTTLDGISPDGSTPTTVSLKAAQQALNALVINPDALPRAKYVVLVTDGEPNCRPGELQAVLACGIDLACVAKEVQKTQIEAVAAVQAMADEGIKTYVLGYQTAGTASLDELAKAGDTGDTQHRAVENEAGLVAEFERIATKAVSCDFVLDQAPADPKFVLVQMDGQQLNLDQLDGWRMSADGRRVTVQGSACTALQDGKDHVLSVRVLCEVVAPI